MSLLACVLKITCMRCDKWLAKFVPFCLVRVGLSSRLLSFFFLDERVKSDWLCLQSLARAFV
jgi:hypothetical protein